MKQIGKKEQMSGPWRQQDVFPLVLIATGFPHRMAPSATVMPYKGRGDMRENENHCSCMFHVYCIYSLCIHELRIPCIITLE